MNDVPLVKDNKINDINTSIIAIKKQLKQLNEAVGLIDIPDTPNLSPYVKKSDIVDAVTSGDMHPVTSNAVADALNETPIKKNIAYSYTGNPANLEEIIKQIIEDQLNYSTTETNTYTGQISSTHIGSGDFGIWNGTYLISVIKNNLYGTTGFVSAQGYGFNIMLENGTIVVKRFESVENITRLEQEYDTGIQGLDYNSANSIILTKVGRLVVARIYLSTTTNLADGTILGEIPSDYRPIYDDIQIVVSVNGNESVVQVRTDGKIRCWGSTGNQVWQAGSGAWFH